MSTTQSTSELRGQYKAKAYAADSAESPLTPTMIPRRDPGENDVQIEILFCGICHSDLHQVRNEWSAMPTVYPCVPGHEIVGRVTKVGSAVTRLKPGDVAAVGCLVDSDGNCPECQDGLEQYCPHMILTYNSPDHTLEVSLTAAIQTVVSSKNTLFYAFLPT
jgi:alcohol dehydrogenase (NADP+)